MKNYFTLVLLPDTDSLTVSRLGPEELMLLQEQIVAEAAHLKRASAALLAGLERRYRDDIKPGTTGTQHIEDGDFDVRCELPKRVEWDSNRLGEMLPGPAWNYIRISYDVLESRYAAAPPEIRVTLDQARTVKTGAPKFTITRRKPE